MDTGRSETAPVPVEVTLRGDVPDGSASYAQGKVEHVARLAREPILSAHVVLTVASDPAAADMFAAVDFLEEKLEKNIVQHADRVRTRHRWIGEAAGHEWRHGDLPSRREAYFPRPPEQREVVRHKTFALEPMTPDEAAFDMDLLGHDFYLFTDLGSGNDALVYRDGGDGKFALQGETVPYAEAGTLLASAGAAPELSEGDAIDRLNLSGEPFLFFLDPDSGRGRVLYLRYDGHYGLITATET